MLFCKSISIFRERKFFDMGLITKLFGTYSERELKSIYPIVDKIEAMADEYRAPDGRGAARQDAGFRARLPRGEPPWSTLAGAFATVREAAGRVLGFIPTACSSSAASCSIRGASPR